MSSETINYAQAMDAILEGKVVRHARDGDRELGRKIFRDPNIDPAAVTKANVHKHLVKSENNELSPYPLRDMDRITKWVIVD